MKNTTTWRKPELICLETKELVCKIKLKASSLPSCSTDYAGDQACPELSVGDTWCNTLGYGEDGSGEIGCGILSQCIEVGPLFGCNDDAACSTMAPVLR